MTSQTVESLNAIDPSERQRLDDFLLHYAHTLDDEDVEAWPSFFHEQGLIRSPRETITKRQTARDHVMRQSRHDGRSMLALRTAMSSNRIRIAIC